MRIAIVNDMQMVVELLRRIIESIPDCEIAWCAYDGMEAVEKCLRDTPDLLIMDIIMPRLDGVGATRQIMKKAPLPDSNRHPPRSTAIQPTSSMLWAKVPLMQSTPHNSTILPFPVPTYKKSSKR